MTAQEVYEGTVQFLNPQEQARLASLILDAIEQVALPERPDRFFTQTQITRLKDLMRRTQGGTLMDTEQKERDALIDAELLASASRTAALADALGK